MLTQWHCVAIRAIFFFFNVEIQSDVKLGSSVSRSSSEHSNSAGMNLSSSRSKLGEKAGGM